MFGDHNYSKSSIRMLVDTTKRFVKKRYDKNEEFEYIDISSIDNTNHEVVSSTTYNLQDASSRAQQCLKTNDVLDYQIYDAPIDEQNEFASFANQADKLKFTNIA